MKRPKGWNTRSSDSLNNLQRIAPAPFAFDVLSSDPCKPSQTWHHQTLLWAEPSMEPAPPFVAASQHKGPPSFGHVGWSIEVERFMYG
jgi:hypothetical protein